MLKMPMQDSLAPDKEAKNKVTIKRVYFAIYFRSVLMCIEKLKFVEVKVYILGYAMN